MHYYLLELNAPAESEYMFMPLAFPADVKDLGLLQAGTDVVGNTRGGLMDIGAFDYGTAVTTVAQRMRLKWRSDARFKARLREI